jgi:glycosyltransferase involved in cell wall biosynthesis
MSQTIISNESPQITTIICTYRRPHWLRRAILSVQKQTYQNFCIYVYDNCSGDETPEVVAELAQQDSRIHYIGRPENIGLLANYAEAMQEVKTPFFSFLADDDVILPNFYATAIDALLAQPESLFFAGSFLSLSLQGYRVGGSQLTNLFLYPPDGMFHFVESKIDPNLHGTLFRQEVLKKCAGFSKVLNWADRDLLYRIAACHPVTIGAPECLLFTAHNLDKGGEVTIDFAWRENESLRDNLKALLNDEDNQRLQVILDNRTREAIYFLGIELLYRGDFHGAKTGAQKLRQDYGVFWPPFILNTLAIILAKFPRLHRFLASTRDLRTFTQQRVTQFSVLEYDTLMDIYNHKKY